MMDLFTFRTERKREREGEREREERESERAHKRRKPWDDASKDPEYLEQCQPYSNDTALMRIDVPIL